MREKVAIRRCGRRALRSIGVVKFYNHGMVQAVIGIWE